MARNTPAFLGWRSPDATAPLFQQPAYTYALTNFNLKARESFSNDSQVEIAEGELELQAGHGLQLVVEDHFQIEIVYSRVMAARSF